MYFRSASHCGPVRVSPTFPLAGTDGRTWQFLRLLHQSCCSRRAAPCRSLPVLPTMTRSSCRMIDRCCISTARGQGWATNEHPGVRRRSPAAQPLVEPLHELAFAPGGSLFDPVASLSQIEFGHVIKSILARQAMRKLSALHYFLQDLCIFAFQAIPFFRTSLTTR